MCEKNGLGCGLKICEKSVHPIDLWVEKNPYIKELINDLVEHLDNSVNPTPENGIDEFKRLAAISIRQFLEDQ